MEADIVIRAGQIVTADCIFQADVAIAGESIVAVGQGLSGKRIIDAAGKYVIRRNRQPSFLRPRSLTGNWHTAPARRRARSHHGPEMPNSFPRPNLMLRQSTIAARSVCRLRHLRLLAKTTWTAQGAVEGRGRFSASCAIPSRPPLRPTRHSGIIRDPRATGAALHGTPRTLHHARRQSKLEAAVRTDRFFPRPSCRPAELRDRAVARGDFRRRPARAAIAHKSSARSALTGWRRQRRAWT